MGGKIETKKKQTAPGLRLGAPLAVTNDGKALLQRKLCAVEREDRGNTGKKRNETSGRHSQNEEDKVQKGKVIIGGKKQDSSGARECVLTVVVRIVNGPGSVNAGLVALAVLFRNEDLVLGLDAISLKGEYIYEQKHFRSRKIPIKE